MKHKVFIDGQEGTTGLRIGDYLSDRSDIELLQIDAGRRKDREERRKLLNEADIVFLCLPDAAAREAVELIHKDNEHTKIIDSSTAFRTDPSWVYGLPELKGQRENIRSASRLSVPGCHATGLILTIRPLIEAGLLQKNYPLTCSSISGYTGAGKRGIEQYENADLTVSHQLHVPRHYALQYNHKHIPEMMMYAGLEHEPLFTPVIAKYAQGIALSVPLISRIMPNQSTARDVHEALTAYYDTEPFVKVMPYDSEANLDEGHFRITECNNTNRLDMFVFGQNGRVNVMARFDNLGKGASGAAIQNMNIMLGIDEGTRLTH